jgi:hypothetical protein
MNLNLALSDTATISTADGEIEVSLNPAKHGPTFGYLKKIREELIAKYPNCTYFSMPADIVSQILNAGLPAGAIGRQPRLSNLGYDTILKVLIAAVLTIAVTVAIYFLAIYPRAQTSKELAATAAMAGKTTVTVVEPTQTSSAPELILPGNVEAHQPD